MKYKKLFIVGCPRSGTTWARLIFRHHPAVITTKESHAFPIVLGKFWGMGADAPNKILDKYDDDVKNKTVGLHLYVGRKDLRQFVNEISGRNDLVDAKKAELIIRFIFDKFFVAFGGTKNHLFVEKTPPHMFYMEKILKMYPEAKIVEVVRDGRDVCVSLEMLGERWCPATREGQIEEWIKYVKAGMELCSNKSYEGRVLQVKYEDVKKDPFEQIKKMYTFAGIEAHPNLITSVTELTDFKNYIKKGGRYLRRGQVGDWKNHFTSEDIKLFKKMANNFLIGLGYELDDKWQIR